MSSSTSEIETDKLSIALSQALYAFESLRDKDDEVCEFCLSGAALLSRTESSLGKRARSPGDLPWPVERMLRALDELGTYSFANAFRTRYYANPAEEPAVMSVEASLVRRMLLAISRLDRRLVHRQRPGQNQKLPTYYSDPDVFLKNMNMVVRILVDTGF